MRFVLRDDYPMVFAIKQTCPPHKHSRRELCASFLTSGSTSLRPSRRATTSWLMHGLMRLPLTLLTSTRVDTLLKQQRRRPTREEQLLLSSWFSLKDQTLNHQRAIARKSIDFINYSTEENLLQVTTFSPRWTLNLNTQTIKGHDTAVSLGLGRIHCLPARLPLKPRSQKVLG